MRVLVIEDEPKMQRLLVEGLAASGLRAEAVGDGEAALTRTRTERFDAVVLDVMLPGLDGFGVLRAMRARGDATPVLLLTARDAVSDRVAGLDGGADDYLVKPFALVELASRLRALQRRGGPREVGALRCGPLVLDPDARSAHVGDELLDLTALEFDLLELFMRNSGWVLRRPAIIEQVWDHAYDPRSNVVDVHVAQLRRKVERPHGLKLLHTVRGVGYQLRCPG